MGKIKNQKNKFMDNLKKCPKCGEPLKPSQFARRKKEGEPTIKANDNLVCRNYPVCDMAEKEAGKLIEK
jgi:ssDNA-binding Zn-finger/Zn-ribbon topoisomerase 1